MNLFDLKATGIELENKLINMEIHNIVNELKKINSLKVDFEKSILENETSIFMSFSPNTGDWNNRVLNINNSLHNKYNEFKATFFKLLNEMYFIKSVRELDRMNEEYDYFDFNLDKFTDDYIGLTEKIHDFLNNKSREYNDIVEMDYSIKEIVKKYDSVEINLKLTEHIMERLNLQDDEAFKIRLMNENNSVSDLKNSIELIENIYNNVNLLIGNGEELKYTFAQSGSFMLCLAGCGTTLLTMLPVLKLAYKVYSEQLSPEAKIKLELKKVELESNKVKLRGNYLKLIKDATESKELEALNVKDKTEVLNIIGNLDMDIKKLYSNNPFIRLGEEDLGLNDMSVGKVPIELIESADKDIKTLEELEIIEI